MKKYVFIFSILILISTTGCETGPRKLVTPSQSVITHPLLTSWELVGNPEVTQGSFTLGINGFYFESDRILLFYSLTGSTSDQLAVDELFHLIDDSGSVSQLVEMIPLGNIDQLELGIMAFEPRRIGPRDLFLSTTSKSDPKANQKTSALHLNGSAADDLLGRIFYGATLTNSELAGYQISILWSTPSENQSGGANTSTLPENTSSSGSSTTPTVVVRPPAISLSPGVVLQAEFSFKIENINNQPAQYLYVQLYSDGNVA